ncbi:MAG: hypothetical protein RLY20_19 [Verrucomicrobiota bacterium]|jgi:hypothetical protein
MKPILFATFLMIACAGCRTSKVVDPSGPHGTIVRIKGAARYSNDLLGWNDAKVGAVLESGAVLQTSDDGTAHIELGPTRNQPHVAYLRENGVLKLEQLGVTNSNTIQLRLRAGNLRSYVMPMTDESYFEAGTSNLLVRSRGGIFYLDVAGTVHVSAGTAVVLGAGNEGVRSLAAGQCYDHATGVVTTWDTSAYAETDVWPPKQTKSKPAKQEKKAKSKQPKQEQPPVEPEAKTVQSTDDIFKRDNSALWGRPPRLPH